MRIRGYKAVASAGLAAMTLALCATFAPAQTQTTVVFTTPFNRFAQDVEPATVDGPSPSQRESNINDYTFQDEQINILPTDGILRAIRTDQKRNINDFVVATIPIANVTPREIRNVLRILTGLEGGRAEVIRDMEADEYLVQVTAPSWMIPYLEQTVQTLDQPWVRENQRGSATLYYKAKNRPIAGIDNLASQYASDNGFSVLDSKNNAVSRVDEPYRIQAYLEAAAIVDIPANEVVLEVKIYQVTASNDQKMGLDYINWKNGPGRGLASFVANGADAQSRNESLSSIFDPFFSADMAGVANNVTERVYTDFDQYFAGLNYLLTSNFVEFLNVTGRASVVLEETKTVKSANSASFAAADEIVAIVSSVGDEALPGVTNATASRFSQPGNVPGQDVSFIEDETGGGALVGRSTVTVRDPSRRVHYRRAGSTGVFMDVTPFVGLESMELVISLQMGDLSGLAPNGQPIISTRTVQSTVRLLNGEPYVIAGLRQVHDIRETAKMPFLGDIPGLGYIFGGEIDVQRWDNVVIVVTPHFVLSSQSDIYTPWKMSGTAAAANGGPVALPEGKVGYDQWILDSNN